MITLAVCLRRRGKGHLPRRADRPYMKTTLISPLLKSAINRGLHQSSEQGPLVRFYPYLALFSPLLKYALLRLKRYSWKGLLGAVWELTNIGSWDKLQLKNMVGLPRHSIFFVCEDKMEGMFKTCPYNYSYTPSLVT